MEETTAAVELVEEAEPFFTTDLIIMYAVCIFIMIAFIGFILGRKYIADGRRSGKIKGSTSDYILLRLYRFYRVFPLTEGSLNHISTMLQSSCLYSQRKLFQVAAKWQTIYIGTVITIGCLAFVLYDDLLSILLVFMFAFYFANSMLDKFMDKKQEALYEAYRKSLSAVQEGYMKTGDVAEAINEADIDEILKPIFAQIYAVLTEHNGAEKLREFIERVPFRQLQIFAQICYDINNTGDEIIEGGQSNFQVALESMSEDIIGELERLHYQQDEFGNIEFLALVPIFCMKPLRAVVISAIPALGVIYDSMAGYILRVLVLATSVIAYAYISSANSTKIIKEDDRIYFFTRLAQKPGVFRTIAKAFAPKNYWGYGFAKEIGSGNKIKFGRKLHMNKAHLEKRFRNALSKKSAEEFMLEKLSYSIALTIAVVILLYFSVQLGYTYMYNNTAQLSITGTEFSVEIPQETILEMDREYLRLVEAGETPRGETLTEFVKQYEGGLTEMEIEDECKRLESKAETLSTTYYRWWFTLLALGIGWASYFIPDLLLFFRKRKVESEAETDFLLQQTFMSIFMYTSGDTIDALEHMVEISQIHRTPLRYCYYAYTSDPDGELAWLQAQTPLAEYRRFIGKLRLTTEDMSLSEAFADLRLNMQYIQRERDRKLRKKIHSKAQRCGMVQKIPLYFFLIAYLVFPLGYVSVHEFTSTFSALNS